MEGLEREIGLLRATIHDKVLFISPAAETTVNMTMSSQDVGIADREKRIYALKKKNQELEKFKFVLDYKIKELKMQIEPRENEIAAMRGQIKEVDAELEAYHKVNGLLYVSVATYTSDTQSNGELDALIGSLRAELDGLQVCRFGSFSDKSVHSSILPCRVMRLGYAQLSYDAAPLSASLQLGCTTSSKRPRLTQACASELWDALAAVPV
jgi:hypothetical protein